MRLLVCILFLALSFETDAQKGNDTFSVYFELNVAELGAPARRTIDSLLYLEKIKNGIPISIIGHADYLATDEYNLDLSHRRAENVRNYIIRSGIDGNVVKLLVGRGEVKRTDTLRRERGVAEDRRVDIIMEYKKPPQAGTTSNDDTLIVMRPGDKLIMPPSTTDEGFDITAIPKGKTFILKNIYFPMGRHFPKESSYEELDMLLEAMLENPAMAIQIEGHVCCISNHVPDAYDLDSRGMDLSINRARFIYEYLKARGVAEYRLKYIGYGKTRPIIADEQTQEQAAINRRVEIRILNK